MREGVLPGQVLRAGFKEVVLAPLDLTHKLDLIGLRTKLGLPLLPLPFPRLCPRCGCSRAVGWQG